MPASMADFVCVQNIYPTKDWSSRDSWVERTTPEEAHCETRQICEGTKFPRLDVKTKRGASRFNYHENAALVSQDFLEKGRNMANRFVFIVWFAWRRLKMQRRSGGWAACTSSISSAWMIGFPDGTSTVLSATVPFYSHRKVRQQGVEAMRTPEHC